MSVDDKHGKCGFYENIFELSGTGIAQVSLDGKFMMINKHFCDIIGYEREEILGMKFVDITYEEDINRDLNHIQQIIDCEADGYSMEKRYVKKGGSIIWVNLDVTAVRGEDCTLKYFVSVVNDITKRKNDELELKKQSQALRQSPVCIIVTDVQGIIQYANPALYEVSGYTVEEVLGQNPRILNARQLPKEFYRNLWKTIMSGNVWTGTFVNRKKNGEIYYEQSSISPIFNSLNQIDSFVAVKEDITKKKKIQEDLVKSRLEAEKANKAKSVFLANMSHEIRTPLNAILGFAAQLYKDDNLTREQKKNIDIINRSGEHLLHIINSILEISKIEAGKVTIQKTRFELMATLKDIYNMFSMETEKREIKLEVRGDGIGDSPTFIITDEIKLRQILINLVGNSLKFTQQGKITVSVGLFQDKLEKKRLEFKVTDTGEGMSDDELNKVFNYFEQGDSNNSKGTGLGLSITKNFIELLGGEIWVESKLGTGTQFSFFVPVETSEDDVESNDGGFINAINADNDNPLDNAPNNVDAGTVLILNPNQNKKDSEEIDITNEHKIMIRSAIFDGDIDNIYNVIKIIKEQNPEAANIIYSYVTEFKYEEILDLIGS